jgi:hypothetical protein
MVKNFMAHQFFGLAPTTTNLFYFILSFFGIRDYVKLMK